MGTATLTLAGSPQAINDGNAWTVTITGSAISPASVVSNDATYASATVACTTPSLPNLFTMSNNAESFSFYDGKYVTWRSTAALTGLTFSQYPTQGFSLDIWSDALYDAIYFSGSLTQNTWTQIAGTYNLRTDKYSLIYDYSNRYAPVFSKGGTLTISVVA